MTESDTLRLALPQQRTSGASQRNMDCHMRGLRSGVTVSVLCDFNNKAFVGWWK